MATEADLLTHRLLTIDDNPRIHEDSRSKTGWLVKKSSSVSVWRMITSWSR